MITPIPPGAMSVTPLSNVAPATVVANPDEKVALKQNVLVAGQTVPLVNDVKSPYSEDLQRLLKRLNEDARRRKRPFQYVLVEENGEMVIKVIDSETQEVIRKIPIEEAVSIAQDLENAQGVILRVVA